MIKIRKDKLGRVLNNNEGQIKNGSYTFRYEDIDGRRKSVSSWKLFPDDKGHPDKPDEECLRDKEKRILRSLEKGKKPITDSQATFTDFWEKYIAMKCEIAESTLVGYIYLYNKHIRNSIGKRLIASLKYSDIKKYYISLLNEGLGISSLDNINNIVSPVFQLAVREGYIESNPADGVIQEFKRRKNRQQSHREALTKGQQDALVNFVSGSYEFKNWLPMLTLFLGCGLRAGELLGLRWEDINFERNYISVNHTLNYKVALDGKCQYYITFPKTNSGIREIPMLDAVRETLLSLFERRNDFNADNQVVVDGFTHFIFRDLYGCVFNSQKVNANLKRIRDAYNKQESEKALAEKREPYLLPEFTCHHLRHTFCTRIIESGVVSIKSIQHIMGHAHAETTLRIYASITEDHTHEEMKALNGKMKIK